MDVGFISPTSPTTSGVRSLNEGDNADSPFIHNARRRAHEVLCGVLALDVAGDAVLLLVGDAEGVPVEFVVAAFDGFLGVLHIVA